MNCPTDGTALTITDRTGIEIDYCPRCRGVWLDRGELDKIIERAAPQTTPAYPTDARRDARHDHDDDDWDHQRGGRSKRKRGMLGDLFDF